LFVIVVVGSAIIINTQQLKYKTHNPQYFVALITCKAAGGAVEVVRRGLRLEICQRKAKGGIGGFGLKMRSGFVNIAAPTTTTSTLTAASNGSSSSSGSGGSSSGSMRVRPKLQR
jgi:hypothetical protein